MGPCIPLLSTCVISLIDAEEGNRQQDFAQLSHKSIEVSKNTTLAQKTTTMSILSLVMVALLPVLVHGSKYGLLRVGGQAPEAKTDVARFSTNSRSLFDEDFSL